MGETIKKYSIFLILVLFITGNIFSFNIPFVKADSQKPEIYYSDRDYITVNITEKDEKYSLNIESKNLGAVDWIGYIFPLTPTSFESSNDFYEKTKNNRSVYNIENHQPLGIVYAKAKSFFRYLDIISSGVDWAMHKVFGNPFRDTLTIPTKEENIYLIRAYSGGWGKFTDPSEKSFVREKVYRGDERDRQAVILNISLATFDTLGVFIPLADFYGDQLNAIIEAGLRRANTITTIKGLTQAETKAETKEVIKYLSSIAANTGETSLLKAGKIIKDEATQNFFKFISRSCKIAIKVVNVGRKISKAGQVVDRIVQMVTTATPLETSYVVVGNPLLAVEKKEGITREIPEIIKKGGPAGLVPPSVVEKKGNYKEAIINATKPNGVAVKYKVRYLDSIWQIGDDKSELKHNFLNCRLNLDTHIIYGTDCGYQLFSNGWGGIPSGCRYLRKDDINLDKKKFVRLIRNGQIPGKEESKGTIVLSYYSEELSYYSEKLGRVEPFFLNGVTDQNSYKKCATDIEEILKTIIPIFPKEQLKETMPESESIPSGKIVFHSNRNDNFEIYMMDINGTNQTRLTENVGNDQYAVWSPDCTKIAFTSEKDGNEEIYVMNPDGTNQRRLTYNSISDWVPDWSPDGKKIVFTSNRDGNNEIYVMNSDGSNQLRLTKNNADDRDPDWSITNKIAFESNRDGNPKIYVMNADGTNVIRLTNNNAVDRHPAWSPDGSKIAFTSNRDGNDEIYVMNADGSNQERITYNTASDLDPAWSPDGNYITFASNRDGNYEIYVMDANGSNQRRLTVNADEDYRPDWCLQMNIIPPTTKEKPREESKRRTPKDRI